MNSRDGASKTREANTWSMVCRCKCDMKAVPVKPVPPTQSAPLAVPATIPAQSPASRPAASTFIHSPLSSASAVLQLAPPGAPPPAKKPRQSTLSTWILREGSKPPTLQLAPPGAPVNPPPMPLPAVPTPAVPTHVAVKAEPVMETVSACGGTVRITVTDDLSHAYFRGQKIDIKVSHPPRTS